VKPQQPTAIMNRNSEQKQPWHFATRDAGVKLWYPVVVLVHCLIAVSHFV